jgi:hypothetical protein
MAKDGLAILIGAPKGGKMGKGGPPMEDESEMDDMEGDDLTMAAEDMISAIRAKDADMLADAFRAAMKACKAEEGGYESEPESGEDEEE